MATHRHLPPPSLAELGLVSDCDGGRRSGGRLPKLKRFRFQLLADFLVERFPARPRIADVGGGKGFLTYLLRERGFDSVVVDPHDQPLPTKYRDLASGRRIKIDDGATVPRIAAPFSEEQAVDFDVLVGLHAHGSNLNMLGSAARYGKTCVLLPCCVIDEPGTPDPGTSWFNWLTSQACERGLSVDYFHLNFKGQNVGFVAS